MIPDLHIMGDMNVGHDETITAHTSHHAICGGAVDCDTLADACPISDFDRGGLAVVFQVLGIGSNNAARKKLAIAASFGVPEQCRMWTNPRPFTDMDVWAYVGEGINGDSRTDVGGRIHMRQR